MFIFGTWKISLTDYRRFIGGISYCGGKGTYVKLCTALAHSRVSVTVTFINVESMPTSGYVYVKLLVNEIDYTTYGF
jgi:hypothetical protein